MASTVSLGLTSVTMQISTFSTFSTELFTITPSTTLPIEITPSTAVETSVTSEPATSFLTSSVVEITTSLPEASMFTPTPTLTLSSFFSSTAITSVPTLSSEVTPSLTTIVSEPSVSVSSSIELSSVLETSSLQPTPEPSTSSFLPSLTPTPSLSLSPTESLFSSAATTVLDVESSSVVTFSLGTTVFSSTPLLSSSLATTIETSSAVVTTSLEPSFASSTVLPMSTPLSSSITDVTMLTTSTLSLTLSTLAPTIETSSAVVTTSLEPSLASSTALPMSTPLSSSIADATVSTISTLSLTESVETSTFTTSSIATIVTSFTTIAEVATTPVITSSPVLPVEPTSRIFPSVMITPTPTPQTSPIPSCPPPPVAPLTLAVEGLGSPLQAEPTPQDDSRGLQYKAEVGAYIATTDSKERVGRVSVGFGRFSGVSESFTRSRRGSVSIIAAVASNEVWQDYPFVDVAVQVRDVDGELGTRGLNQEVVTVKVSQTESNPQVNSCRPDFESGVCSVRIQLQPEWFTNSDQTVDITVSQPDADNVSLSVALKPAIAVDTSSSLFMQLPSHPVFPGSRIDIPIYARYNYLLSSFSLNCSVGENAKIIDFTGPTNWSLIPSILTDMHTRGSVTGFRNRDTANVADTNLSIDHLTNLSVEIVTSVSSEVEICIKCKAVDLIFTTRDRPEVNIYANGTNRTNMLDEMGVLIAQPNSSVKLFAHSNTNQFINIASLTSEQQYFSLSVQAFYRDGSLQQVTKNLTCSSHNKHIVKVESNCLHFFVAGNETSSGKTQIEIMDDNSEATGGMPLRVWLPTNTSIDVENHTLNRIDTSMCSGNSSLFQRTRVYVVTTLISIGMTPINSVYITSKVLPYLNTSNSNVIEINRTSAEVLAVRPGVEEIRLVTGILNLSVLIRVNDKYTVIVFCLQVFIFGSIEVSLDGNDTLTAVDINLRQEFAYVNSNVKVVGVAMFNDGRQQVLDADTLTITQTTSGMLQQIQNDHYLIMNEVNQIGFGVVWNQAGCIIAQGENTVNFNSSVPESLLIEIDSNTVAYSGDPVHLLGIPDRVNVTVFLVYEDRNVDVTLNNNTKIELSTNLVTVKKGEIIASGPTVNGFATITATFNTTSKTLQDNASVTVVTGEELIVSAHPFPPYEGSDEISLVSIKKIGSSYQQVEIKVNVNDSEGKQHNVPLTFVNISVINWLEGNVLTIPANTASPVVVEVTFGSLSETLTLALEDNNQLVVKNISITFNGTGLNHYQVFLGFIFDGGIIHNNLSVSEYQNLVTFNSTSHQTININATGSIEVLSNSNEFIVVCATSMVNSENVCGDFAANLQPESGQVDLGSESELPFSSVTVGDNLMVPVFLNLDTDKVAIFEMELTFDNEKLQFIELSYGSDWESGQILFVHPSDSENHINFGGILHGGAQGLRLNLANIVFNVTDDGSADFSVNVSFIAKNDVAATLVDIPQQVSNSSRVSVEVTYAENRRRRGVDDYSLVHGDRLRRRQADTEPLMGDTNGDGVVDLRDVYRLQLYVAESVLNFRSPTGQQLQDAIDDTLVDLDGDGIPSLSDILELEIITLNLAYTANVNTTTVGYNSTIDKCYVEIVVRVESVSRHSPPPADIKLHVIVGFLSTEQEFENVFDSINFITSGVDKSGPYQNQMRYGGSVKMVLNPVTSAEFRLDGNVDLLSVGFNVSATVIVTSAETDTEILSFDTAIRDLDEARNVLNLQGFPLLHNVNQVPSGQCVRPSSSSSVTPTAVSTQTTIHSSSVSTGNTDTTQTVLEPSSSSTETKPTTTKTPTEDSTNPSTANPAAGIVGGVLGGIIALLAIVLVVCGGAVVVRRKKGMYLVDHMNGVHIRRNSMISEGSSGFWRDTENGIEMSPRHSNIDIVPLEHYGSMLETNIDVVANHCVIMSEDPYGSTSLKPLVHNGGSPERGPPKKGSGPATLGSRAHQTSSYIDTGTMHTGATTMAGYTSSSMERSTDYDEDEDEGQLVLPDYDASQAYLSLGLTPLSQLSPDAHTSNDFGYFPSMPPPVAPSTSSIFSMSTSTSSLGMDNPFSLHSGGGQLNGIIDSSTMPDAYPERRCRKNKYETQPLSQGFPMKLEPVLEQSPPISNSQFSERLSSPGEESLGGSPTLPGEPPSTFLFPSAAPSQEFSRQSQGRTALRVKRPGGKGGSRENLNAVSPRRTSAQGGGYGSLAASKHASRFKQVHSPTKLKHRGRTEERQPQQWQHGHRMYASRESPDSEEPHYSNGFDPHEINNHDSPVIGREAEFIELHTVKRSSSRGRKGSSASNSSIGQAEELSSPHKWTPRHARHSSLDDSPMKSHRLAERSESTHLYTTYEHR